MVHQSYVVYAPLSIKKILDKCTNQRLEFLGDALLQIHVTKLLYTAFPDYDQGGLTIGRSQLVSNRACLKFAKQLKLEDHLLQIDQDVDKRLGDAFEALIGAIYIDGNYHYLRTHTIACIRIPLQDQRTSMQHPYNVHLCIRI